MSPLVENEGPPKTRKPRGNRGQRNKAIRNGPNAQRPPASHSQSEPSNEVPLIDRNALNDLNSQVLPDIVYQSKVGDAPPTTRRKGRRNRDAEDSVNALQQQQLGENPKNVTVHEQPMTPPRSKDRNLKNMLQDQDASSRAPNAQNARSNVKSARVSKPRDIEPPSNTSSKPAGLGAFGGTPAKLYAGPDFRASPAPSTIPIPKFLSRSVPNVNKTRTLNNFPDRESQETSTGDESPTPEAATPTPFDARGARDESPLDVLFRKDREAKACASQKRPDFSADHRKTSSPNYLQPAESPLGSRTNRHHVRHNTDGSANGVFPLEMEGAARQLPIPYRHAQDDSVRNSDAADVRAANVLEEKSLALKKLLNFSEQKSTPQQASHQDPFTPSRKPASQGRSSARLSGTPPLFPSGLEGTTHEERQAALMASLEKRVSSTPTYTSSSYRPPSSSGLRHQMRIPDYAGTFQQPHEAHQVPNSARNGERNTSWLAHQHGPSTTGHIDTIPTDLSYGNAQHATRSRDADMKNMESDLRRILKLDGLPNGGDVR